MATIVSDTSAVSHDLQFVQDLVKEAPKHLTDILLPRESFRELDRIKDRSQNTALQSKARQAINWINSVLAYQNPDEPSLRGQKITETVVPNLTGDEAILDCALYNQNATNKMTISSSEDHNSCNRALVDGIETLETKNAHSKKGVSIDEVFKAIHAKTMSQMDIDYAPTESINDSIAKQHVPSEQASAGSALPRGSAADGTTPDGSAPSVSSSSSSSLQTPLSPLDVPPPVQGANLENEIKENIAQLLDWHVHQSFTDEELEFLKYRKPKTSREFAKISAKSGFSFSVNLPSKFVNEFQEIVKQGTVDRKYVSKHIESMMRLAGYNYQYKLLLHKYDEDAMIIDV